MLNERGLILCTISARFLHSQCKVNLINIVKYTRVPSASDVTQSVHAPILSQDV